MPQQTQRHLYTQREKLTAQTRILYIVKEFRLVSIKAMSKIWNLQHNLTSNCPIYGKIILGKLNNGKHNLGTIQIKYKKLMHYRSRLPLRTWIVLPGSC